MPKALSLLVCVKSVVLAAPEDIRGGNVPRNAENSVVNPFDKPALKMGLELAKSSGGTLTALSMGPEAARQALMSCLAQGADRAVLLSDPLLAGSDTLATSRALAAAIGCLGPFDLVLFGVRSADSDTGQVAAQAAELAGLPFLSFARSAEPGRGGLKVKRSLDGFSETYRLPLPAALSVHPRAPGTEEPGLLAIEKTYAEDRVQTLDAAEAGIEPGQAGEAGSPTRVLSMTRVRSERSCEFLPGTAEKQAQALLDRLLAQGLLR